MKHYSSKMTENFDELIHSLRQRIDTLQSQYVGFVTFCTNLVNTHISAVHKELNNLTMKSIQSGVIKTLEYLEMSYENATNDFGFSVSSKNVQEALDKSQKQIIAMPRISLSQIDFEKKVSAVFVSLSEIVNRKILRTRSKSRKSTSKINQLNRFEQTNQFNSENTRIKKFSLQLLQKETQDYKEKVSKLEKKINTLNSELEKQTKIIKEKQSEIDLKDQEIYNLNHNSDISRLTQKISSDPRLKLGSTDGSKLNSICVSPIASPVLGENRKRTQALRSSPDKGFDLERFKQKIEGLGSLLGKFNKYTALIEEAVSTHPELGHLFLNFKSIKSELSFAMMEMFDNQSPVKRKSEERNSDARVNNEVIQLKSENCRLKAEINHKSTEILEINDQVKRLEQELRETRRNLNMTKEESSKQEKEKNEIQIESVYLKSQNEKLQKSIKLMSESMSTTEKKANDFILLQSKYDEIVKNLRFTPKILSMHIVSTIEVKCKFRRMKIESVTGIWIGNRKNLGLKFANSEIEEVLINKKVSQAIAQKNKVEEDLMGAKEELAMIKDKLDAVNEEKRSLNSQLCEALETWKIFEEILAKTENENKRKSEKLDFTFPEIISLNQVPSSKPPKTPSKIQSFSAKPDQIKKLEDKIQDLEKHLQSSLLTKDTFIKENQSLQSSLHESQELVEQLSLLNSNLQSSNSYLQEKVQNLSLDSKKSPIPSPSKQSPDLSSILSKFSSFSQDTSETFENFSLILQSYNSKLSSIIIQSSSIKTSSRKKTQIMENLTTELKLIQKEKNKLLDTRDKLIIQCNSQSEEIISLKLEQEESFTHKREDNEYEVQVLKNQIKNLQSSESNLLQALKETTDKYTNLVQISSEKDLKIEAFMSELSQLKFKQSIKSLDSNDKYKEEVYNLKMRNIKLEQMIEDLKNSSLSQEELNNIKNSYISQINKIDEDRIAIEKKLKDSEYSWNREKDSLQRSLDSFTKQLAGANLEIHNLKQKVKDLNLSIKPVFHSNDDYRIVRVVDYERTSWYLLEVVSTKQLIWTSNLPFENIDELKDPLPNLIMERGSLQKLNSELCVHNNKLRNLIAKIESIAKRDSFYSVLNLIFEGKGEKTEVFEIAKREEGRRCRPSRIGRPGDVKTLSELSDKGSIDSRKSNQSNKSTAFRIILQDKDEELGRKNDCIRKQEIGIVNLKEENNRLKEHLERFNHFKILAANLQSINPKMNTESSMILKNMIGLAESSTRYGR